MPPVGQSFSNSQYLVKVGIPEMWKSIMDDSSFGLSTRQMKKKGIKRIKNNSNYTLNAHLRHGYVQLLVDVVNASIQLYNEHPVGRTYLMELVSHE